MKRHDGAAAPGRRKATAHRSRRDGGEKQVAPAAVFARPMRVCFQHTNAGGVLFHGHYFGFIECARTELMQSLGFDLGEIARRDKVLFVVHSAQIAYHRPAQLNDALRVTAQITKIGRSRLEFVQQVRRDDLILASARLTLVCVDAQCYKPIPLPGQFGKNCVNETEAVLTTTPSGRCCDIRASGASDPARPGTFASRAAFATVQHPARVLNAIPQGIS